MSWKKALYFALTVDLAGIALDVMVHLATGTAVHFNYVAEKAMVVGFALFLFAWWMGAGWKKGIGFVFLASSLFWVYYQFAVPTLDRAVFTLDEQIKWVFLHFIVIYIPYLMALDVLDRASLAAPAISKKKYAAVALLGWGMFALMVLPGIGFVVNNGLVIGRTYNDHIAIGIAFLTFGVAASCKLLALSRNQ